MTYETNQYGRSDFDRENSRSADYMATFFVIITVIWLAGAALMFTAAIKGSAVGPAPVAGTTTQGAETTTPTEPTGPAVSQ